MLDRNGMLMMQRSRMYQMAHMMSSWMGVHSRMTMVGHKGSRMVAVVAVDLVVLLVHGMVGAMVGHTVADVMRRCRDCHMVSTGGREWCRRRQGWCCAKRREER